MRQFIETICDAKLSESPIHGTGLFTTRDRHQDEILTVLDGQLVTHEGDMDLLLAYEWNAVSKDQVLLRPVWTSYGYINHADPGNLTFNLVDRALRMACDVSAGTELTLNYLEHGIPQVYFESDHGNYLR
jgi:hypothetical protein